MSDTKRIITIKMTEKLKTAEQTEVVSGLMANELAAEPTSSTNRR